MEQLERAKAGMELKTLEDLVNRIRIFLEIVIHYVASKRSALVGISLIRFILSNVQLRDLELLLIPSAINRWLSREVEVGRVLEEKRKTIFTYKIILKYNFFSHYVIWSLWLLEDCSKIRNWEEFLALLLNWFMFYLLFSVYYFFNAPNQLMLVVQKI